MSTETPATARTATPQPRRRPRRPLLRPVLRPGLHVLRRNAHELQVGLDSEHALVVPDREPFRSLLDALARPAAPAREREYDAEALEVLAEAELLADLDDVMSLVAERRVSLPSAGGDIAAVALRAGTEAAALLDRRSRGRVVVRTHGPAEPVAQEVVATLGRAGVTVVADRTAEPGLGRADPAAAEHTVGVLVAVGEPAREELDPWLREGVAHAVVRLSEGRVVVGPFVVPGSTACLRCVDAHLTDVDPAWPVLVMQQAAASSLGRLDAVPEPCDPTLAALAAAWTARDLLTHLEGGNPSTTSGTLRLSPDLTTLEAQTWARHPGCGCSWDGPG